MSNSSDDKPTGQSGPASISTGPNARPRNETISQTGPGLPDDSSQAVEVDEAEAKAIERRIRSI
ncbi:hypothetical protein [Mangrovicella endophytica]|uniref:hypothetical protein n=1 Tax=Mangrovicella endophytica TaxID=2066697 RepID=UPI000C9EC5A8|nr:hypothetical protein [Mangrovicella endophytica]